MVQLGYIILGECKAPDCKNLVVVKTRNGVLMTGQSMHKHYCHRACTIRHNKQRQCGIS